MRKALAIITARGGSKRIPRKNIKEFCGKPMIAYSIEAALEAGIFAEVMVSTDDEEIARIAERYGASVPFMRSAETANDFATTADVIKEVIEKYKDLGKEFESFCCIYPTAPLISKKELVESGSLLNDDYATVVPVVRFSYPIQRAVRKESGYGVFDKPEMLNVRSQDLEVFYHDAGQFYWANTNAFIQKPQFIGNKCRLYEIDEMKVQDIDNLEDWKIAELKYRIMKDEN